MCRLEVRVGLKLALCFKISLLEVLKLCFNSLLLEVLKLILPPVSHHHKALFHPGGALVLVFNKFKTILRLVKAFFIAVSAEAGIPCAGLTPLFHAGNFPFQVLDVVA